MRFIIACTPMTGHVNPLLAGGGILHDAGHEVVFVSAEPVRQQAESTGMRFFPLAQGGAVDFAAPNAGHPERENVPLGPERALFDFRVAFVDPIPEQFATLKELCKSFPADGILVDTTFGGTLPFLLGGYPDRPMIASLGVVALPFHRDDGAPFGPGLPPVDHLSPEAEQYRRMAAEGEAIILKPMQQVMNSILSSVGAGEIPMSYFDSLVALPDIFLQPGLAECDVPRSDLPDTVHYIGALPALTVGELPPEVQAKLKGDKKVVVVTQGTVANRDLSDLVWPVMEAMKSRDDVVVIATTGGADLPSTSERLPENAILTRYLPMDTMLGHADLLVTNGGFNTVMRAHGEGVPLIVAGEGADKAEVAARVAFAGCGINLGTSRPTVQSMAEAVDTVLTRGCYRRKAEEIRAKLALMDTPGMVVRLLEGTVQKHADRSVGARKSQ
jgi:UDP:flavonoid glycosyltransferase YjiC (YdhE family)